MQFSLMTYNLNKNQAYNRVPELLDSYKPDVVTLQEIDTAHDKYQEIAELGYDLVGLSHSFFKSYGLYGVATFAKRTSLEYHGHSIIDLPRGWYEIATLPLLRLRQRRTILKTHVYTDTKKKIRIYNVHLTPYSTNRLRKKQIRRALESVHLDQDVPTIITGDFNYPYRRKAFESMFQKYGLQEATSNIFHTFRSNMKIFPFNLKLDYILYKGLTQVDTQQIPVRYSDHYPLVTTFEL